ncbi:MAG: DUF1080 domain-containing protein [Acidobacteriota bacterium]|nr:DUF1080 domain-containing protein [Acidobacteriota bacterium]
MIPLLLALVSPVAPVSLEDPRWKVEAKESRIERYQGRDALFVRLGVAWLEGVSFQDGTVEFDVAMPPEAGFHGLAFRAQDSENYEHIYLRPHLSDKPDATQYQPVFNGVAGWQIYSDPRYAQPATIPADRWVHVKAAFRGKRLELSVDGHLLIFPDLVRPLAAGKIGLMTSASLARFANVIVRPNAFESEGGEGAKAPETLPGIVEHWRVSSPFPEAAREWPSLKWDSIDATVRGIANLATARNRDGTNNTVFAAVTLRAQKAGPVRVRFGFSDRVVVYLNGQPLYRGNDKFQTRDYRFLGTVGLFDELVLPLNRGDSKLWFAVSEDFGGWAVTMQIVDPGSVTVVAAE